VLARHRSVIYLSERAADRHDGGTLMGGDRWALLAEAKIVINLHRDTDAALDWRRVVDCVHAGAVVVTEHSYGIAPLMPGEHLLVASPEALPYVAESLLRDEPRLAQMRTAAYERLRSWLPFAFPVSMLRAALVELVGEPVPAGASLGASRPAAGSDAVGTAGPVVESGPIAESGPVAGVPAADGAPDVTVLTAATTGADALAATLDSVWSAPTAQATEVVVAVARSDPGMRAAVERWMQRHGTLAVRVVAVDEAGLGAARTAALAAARGALCLFLDAGQRLYPRCIDTLAAALREAPDAVAAYPIQVIGADDVTSYRDWDAWRDRRDDDLHLPAMLRLAALREIGAMPDSDRGLWSAIADRNWRAELVPEPLARRPRPSSVVAA
jgi:hypothetical protein